MKKQKMVSSKLHCEKCGNIYHVPRKRGKRREEGHIKHMFCIRCNETTAHIEDNRSSQEKEWDKIQEQLLSGRI